MRMEQFEVSLSSDGFIVISQGEEAVVIQKEQAALLCEWVLSAAKESTNG